MPEIPQKRVAKVLWDAGFRSPRSMKRRGNIPERSAERYIQCFKQGGDFEGVNGKIKHSKDNEMDVQ